MPKSMATKERERDVSRSLQEAKDRGWISGFGLNSGSKTPWIIWTHLAGPDSQLLFNLDGAEGFAKGLHVGVFGR